MDTDLLTVRFIRMGSWFHHEPISRSLHMQLIFESTFARIFLFLERTLEQETPIYINLQQFARFKYSFTALFVFVRQ